MYIDGTETTMAESRSKGIRIPQDVEEKVVKMKIAGHYSGSRVVREVVQNLSKQGFRKSGERWQHEAAQRVRGN